MENKKQAGSTTNHGYSSSMSLDHLFGPKDSSSASSLSLFGSIFPPVSSTGHGREIKQDYGSSGKNRTPSVSDNKSTQGYYYSSKGESVKGNYGIPSKDSIYQNEDVEPCNFSSSIYYGGQENYSPRTAGTTESHQHHTSKKDGGDDDASGNNSNGASRGNWWQGSLYY